MREPLARREVTLLDLVDSILQRGTALSADLILSVADVDLVQLDLRALLASVDTLERVRSPLAPAPSPAVDRRRRRRGPRSRRHAVRPRTGAGSPRRSPRTGGRRRASRPIPTTPSVAWRSSSSR